MPHPKLNPTRRAFLWRSAWLVAPFLFPARPLWAAQIRPELDVRNYGARGDGRTIDTSAIQAAIDAAARAGGTVAFPRGAYLSGTLHLRSHITLRLDAGATLIASEDDDAFDPVEELGYETFSDTETSDFRFALLQGRGLTNVSILGPGLIDGNRTRRGGPKPIALRQCRVVRIRDLTIANAPNYNVSLLGCDGVDISGVTIRNGYSDGIDPDCCRNVRITNCRIESRDDAIVLKTSFALGLRRATQNVRVTNCHLTTLHNGLKLGTESTGDFNDIVFSNCTIVGEAHPWKGDLTSGVSLTTVDGGRLERIIVSHIRMSNVRAPIFVRRGKRGRGQDVPIAGTLENISISNVVAVGAITASSITGVPGYPVSEIRLENVRITARGGGEAQVESPIVPEMEKRYPDAYMFRDLPAYGLYCRHVRGLTLNALKLDADRPDGRPAVVLHDVHRGHMRSLHAMPPAEGQPLIWLRSVRGYLLTGLRARAGTAAVLRLSGADTAGVRVTGNDFSRASRAAMVDASVDETALRMADNVMPRPPRRAAAPAAASNPTRSSV